MTAALRAAIVVTNHDYADYVGDAIDSALAQQGGGVEVIVVDDGSTDDSLDVISRYGGAITVVAQENGGQGAAFNAGVARVNAPIVFLLDADDRLAPDIVERAVAAFADPNVGRVQFRLALIDRDGVALGAEIPDDGATLASGDVRSKLTRFPDDLTWQPTSGNAFRTAVLERIFPMPTDDYRICADYYVSNLSAVYGEVVVLDGVGGEYRVHGENRDYAAALSLDAMRANIVRTSTTHRHLIDECADAGLPGLPDDPDAVLSVTALAMRIASLRLDPARHPLSSDSRSKLVRAGIRASSGRFDIGWGRRLVMVAWFVAMGAVPHRLVRAVAGRFVAVTD